MQVTPANVLQIRNALLAESQLLHDKVLAAQRQVHVGKPGNDEVSESAAEGFNTKIKALLDQCQAYVDALAAAAGNLSQMAKSYGHTEQQINDSFKNFQTDHPAPTSLPAFPTSPGPPRSFVDSLASTTSAQPSSPPIDHRSLFPGANGER